MPCSHCHCDNLEPHLATFIISNFRTTVSRAVQDCAAAYREGSSPFWGGGAPWWCAPRTIVESTAQLESIAQAHIEHTQRHQLAAKFLAERDSAVRYPGEDIHVFQRTGHGVRHDLTAGMRQADTVSAVTE